MNGALNSQNDRGIDMEEKVLKELIFNCVISVHATVSGTNQLILEYSVLNQGSESVALFNRLYKGFDSKGRPIVDVNFVGVEFRENVIVIAKKLFPIPAGTLVETPYLPYLTIVSPGTRFEERIVLNLPLVTWDPYSGNGNVSRLSAGKSLPVFFELGMFVLSQQNVLGTTESTLGSVPSIQAFTESAQRIVRLGPLPISVRIDSKH